MEGGYMYGKTLGVVEYNLTFGTNIRMVNVFGCFRYKKNNNIYIVYADVNTKYEFIHYGSSYIKNNIILSMASRTEDVEVIKEYIYKVINNEDLSDFERFDLNGATGVEIIASNNLEIKLDVIRKLEELMIPKKEEVVVADVKPKKEKKKIKFNKGLLLVVLLSIVVLGGGYFYLSTKLSNVVAKEIVCSREYNDSKLDAIVLEVNTYIFYNNSDLDSVETLSTYKFGSEETYLDFINRGTYYKYIPNDEAVPNFDATTYTFEVKSVKKVDSAYVEPTGYEEVFSYYSGEGYVCHELIEEE